MTKILTQACLLCLCLIMGACSNEGEVDITVTRLDQILAEYQGFDAQKQYEVSDSLHSEISAMFAVLGDADITNARLERWSKSEVVRVFQPAVDSVFPDASALEHEIGQILYRAHRDSLGLPSLRFVTVTWGNARPIVRVDSVVLIALNHFLGSDYPGYAHWPEYRRLEKTPEALPYMLAGVLAATQYPMERDGTPTLLSWMLYEGALVEARIRLVPHAKAEMALGYTHEQMRSAEALCKEIWQDMALKKVVYSTDPMTIDRYMTPAPTASLLKEQTPGRIGRYIGWRIVRAYLSRYPATTLEQMLSPDFYGNAQTLIESGFGG